MYDSYGILKQGYQNSNIGKWRLFKQRALTAVGTWSLNEDVSWRSTTLQTVCSKVFRHLCSNETVVNAQALITTEVLQELHSPLELL